MTDPSGEEQSSKEIFGCRNPFYSPLCFTKNRIDELFRFFRCWKIHRIFAYAVRPFLDILLITIKCNKSKFLMYEIAISNSVNMPVTTF